MGFFAERDRKPPCPILTTREHLIKLSGECNSGKMKAARNIFVTILVLEKELWNNQMEFDTSSAGVRDKGERHLLRELR